MWEAIGLVSSAFTLVAFIVAAAAWAYRGSAIKRERLIKSAPESERAALITNALEIFHVATEGLTKAQRFDLAIEQIQVRAKRFQITAVVVVIIAILAALVSLYAISKNNKDVSALGKTIVLMDSNRASVVYDTKLYASTGRNNADEISEVLDDLDNVRLIKETTSLEWSREDEILAINPSLIIIHISCFYDETHVEDSERKFISFLIYMIESSSHFLIYSRGFHHGSVKWLTHMESQIPELKGRLAVMEVPSGSIFSDTVIRRKLKQKVKKILDS